MRNPLDVTRPPCPLSLKWKLNCFRNVIKLTNFFEGPRDKVSVAFGRLFFQGFQSVHISSYMGSLVMVTVTLLRNWDRENMVSDYQGIS